MVTRIVCVMMLSALAGLSVGCQSSGSSNADMVSPGAVSLCTACGNVKGSDACCEPGATICSCGLHKGSIGCCKIAPGSAEPIMVCTNCGEFKGSAQCCQDAATCAACGLHKGSPGCCKLDT